MPSFSAEGRFHQRGLHRVAGLDEVGRGAWAGPLVAGAVILPQPSPALRKVLVHVNDSKLLPRAQREACAETIRAVALAFGVGIVTVTELDTLGVTRATREAMRRALANLAIEAHALLIDAFPLPDSPLAQRAIIHGDSYSYCIAAASIIAKTARDDMMRALDVDLPAYGFGAHKGYGTPAHQRALRKFGPSAAHRGSFAPIRALAAGGRDGSSISRSGRIVLQPAPATMPGKRDAGDGESQTGALAEA
jgi:ribonuclease HII